MASIYTLEQKQQHIDAWRQSGLTQRTYCQQHAIKHGSFKNWPTDCKTQKNVSIPVLIMPSQSTQNVSLQLGPSCQVNLSIAELVTIS